MDDGRPPTARRAAVSGVGLLLLWGAAFQLTELPYFALIAGGGIVSGLAGVWVRRGAGREDTTRRTAEARTSGSSARLGAPAPPVWALTRGQAALAAVVATTHLGVAHVLFHLGSHAVPHLAPSAEQVYGRPGEVSLWWALVLGGVVTAPLEEVYWRGAVHPLLRGAVHGRLPEFARRPGVTVVAVAAFYALFHVATGEVALVAAALLGGLVWGWLLERTGSIGAPMLAHGLWACGMLAFSPL